MDKKVTQALFDEGTMAALVKAGFISAKAFLYRDIYLWVDAQIKTRNITKNKAVDEAEIKFNVSDRTVWSALKRFD